MVFGFYHQIESAVPTLARPIMSLDATEDAIVGTLKQSLVFFSLFWNLQLYTFRKDLESAFTNHNSHIFASLFAQRQLENLGAQRAGLEDMLKEMKRKVNFSIDHCRS